MLWLIVVFCFVLFGFVGVTPVLEKTCHVMLCHVDLCGFCLGGILEWNRVDL